MSIVVAPIADFKQQLQDFRIADSNHYFGWNTVPPRLKTKKQWLKKLRRLKKDAAKQGTITCVFDQQQEINKKSGDKGPVAAFDDDGLDILKFQLATFGWSAEMAELERAGQAATMNLYDVADTQPITAFAEPEARQLLSALCFDYSHPVDFITKVEGCSSTWKWKYSRPDIVLHLLGQQIVGPKHWDKGKVRILKIDLDRHSANVSAEYQKNLVLRTVDILLKRYPQYRWAAEANPANGSVGLFGVLPGFLPTWQACQVSEQIRETLKKEVPDHPWEAVEIYPSAKGGKGNLQVYAPLRGDKTFITDHVVSKVPIRSGFHKGRFVYSVANYLDWVFFGKTNLSKKALEKHLDEALAKPLPTKEKKRRVGKTRFAKHYAGGGMAELGPWKGRTVSRIMDFFEPSFVLPDNSVTEYANVIAHVAKAQGYLDADETVDLIMEALDKKEDSSFSDRLTDNLAELERVIRKNASKVFDDGGYQPDKEKSARIMAECAKHWAAKGWLLHDQSTWRKEPKLRLVWTAEHEQHVRQLAVLAKAEEEIVRRFYEQLLVFAHTKSEVALSKVGAILESCGINGGSQEKRVEVRQYFEAQGLILLRHRYYFDEASGYRHGNFYVCGPQVDFVVEEAEAVERREEGVAIPYLSFVDVISDSKDEVVVEIRCLHCDRRYGERLAWLRRRYKAAA